MNTSFQVYVISHERSTLPFCLKALEEQTLSVPSCVYLNVESADATNDIVKNCDCNYFLRLDDDMFLHPAALEYLQYKCSELATEAMVAFRLYDTVFQTAKWCGTVKLYNTEACRNYVFEDPGDWSLDIRFMRYLEKNNMPWVQCDSVLGVHANIPRKEREGYLAKTLKRYPALAKGGLYKFDNKFNVFNYPAEKQYKHTKALTESANDYQGFAYPTDFGNFILNPVVDN
jgi:hypothetical protein